MKRIFSSVLTLFLGAGALYAQVPRHSQDIMLQGFYWNSQSLTGWTQLLPEVSDISKSFTMIWLPPSATGEGDNKTGGLNVGYHPQQWSNQQSCWGSPADLKRLTAAFRQVDVHV
ncbi:MAG: alpha-amylase, partial [Alloprevotella tannerae]|nr:alpha-amylase [Alloprevotella tannerae]